MSLTISERRRLSNFCSLSAFALYYYNFLLTFPDEVRVVWRRRLSVPNVLYILIRYSTLVYVVIIVAYLAVDFGCNTFVGSFAAVRSR
ncbi:uncharacterized protein FIBRA_02008 [Fibroporia radiculosa]|uniref:DUF6533 domain-containing protein n=1 Tax=Fibroporia radiculosa TaxID=599839 RepID=J4G1A9_9APHY|nr:uncharacterized protein FIBRA_02008 [Fibroporia radiculosa]CCL99983.1 predicted protein [Fibroporia radiculosa]